MRRHCSLNASASSVLLSPGRHTFDRRIFAYRSVVSDSTMSSTVVILSFCASLSFIVLFLGLESILEGINAGQNIFAWVRAGNPSLDRPLLLSCYTRTRLQESHRRRLCRTVL